MGLVIDTNVFIDAERGRIDLAGLANDANYGGAYIAAISVSELLAGVQLATSAATRTKRSAFAEAVITRIPVLDFNTPVARTYAELYAYFLRTHGRSGHNAHDLLIAATAMAHGHAVLTSNKADFDQVPGLLVECPSLG